MLNPRSFLIVLFISISPVNVYSNSLFNEKIEQLKNEWASTNYILQDNLKTLKNEVIQSFIQLNITAQNLVTNYPDKSAPLIWQAIILSSHASKEGSLESYDKVEQARDLLLKAEKINTQAHGELLYVSLGTLYYQVPPEPFGFGNDQIAEKYLKKALEINPNGIESNLFYGDFLKEAGRYQESKKYLSHALNQLNILKQKTIENYSWQEEFFNARKKEIEDKITQVIDLINNPNLQELYEY